jgi:predicted kinase
VRNPTDGADAEAVLIVGAYGSGKSTLAAQMGELLEKRGLGYAALDFDWLAWASTGGDDPNEAERLFMANFGCVLANYLDAGIERFVLAGAFTDPAELERFVADQPMPTKLVRLVVPHDELLRRLRRDVTAGRHDDLLDATATTAEAKLQGVEDRTVSNDRPIRETALEVLAWLGWSA